MCDHRCASMPPPWLRPPPARWPASTSCLVGGYSPAPHPLRPLPPPWPGGFPDRLTQRVSAVEGTRTPTVSPLTAVGISAWLYGEAQPAMPAAAVPPDQDKRLSARTDGVLAMPSSSSALSLVP